MIKRIIGFILIFLFLVIPFRGDALCAPFFNEIRGFESYGDIIYNEDTVGSGETLEYLLKSTIFVKSNDRASFNRTIKVILPNTSGVVCSIVPLNSKYYTYSNNVFTIIESNIPKYSNPDGWSDEYTEDIAKIHCKMPTVEKYKRGYNFDIFADYENVEKDGEYEVVKTIRDDARNKIDLVNPQYLKSLKKPTAGFTATVVGINFDNNCNGFFCTGETTSDKLTVNYASNNSKFKLMYATGKYYDLFDIRDVKQFNIDNLSGTLSVNLDYGNNYFGIAAQSDGSSEFEKVGKELKEFNTFECLDELDNINFDSQVSEERMYVINRLDVRSNDSTLKSLSISGAKINFNPNLKHYSVNVPNNIAEVTITSKVNHEKAYYGSGFGNRVVKLNEGKNDILVKVYAENGNESVYTIVVNRDLSNNNNLTSISVDGKVIKLTKDKLKYSVKVDNNITKVNIIATTEHEKATVVVDNNKELVEGSNIISLTVTAPNGEKKIYEIDVFRDSLVSSNADLKSIKIKGYKLDFSSNIKKYNLTIKDEEELEIEAVTDSDKAKLLITGNSKLKNESIIKLKVTAEDNKTENIYEIHITKEKKNNSFILILLGVGIVSVAVIGLFVSMIIKSRKKTNKKVDVVSDSNDTLEKQEQIIETFDDSNLIDDDII